MELKKQLEEITRARFGAAPEDCDDKQLCRALLELTNRLAQERSAPKGPGELRLVVHVCVFDRRGRLLIQQRAAEKFIFPNLWDVSVGGGVDAGETSRRGAEREVREELGVSLDLSGLRPSVTVNFDGGFDDFYLVNQDLDLETLVLQAEEVAEVRWAGPEEVLAMVNQYLNPYTEDRTAEDLNILT